MGPSPQVASFYAANGFYVLLDNHLLEDPTAVEDPAAWVQLWAQLVRLRPMRAYSTHGQNLCPHLDATPWVDIGPVWRSI